MKLSKSTIVVLVIILLMLVVAVAAVSATNAMKSIELSGLGHAIAAVDIGGAQAVNVDPVSFTDHDLISPWIIDPGRSMIF